MNNVHSSNKLNNSLSLTVIEMNKKKFVHKMYGKHPEENSEQTLCTHCVPIGEDYLLIRVCNSFFYPLNSRDRNARGGTSQRSILPVIYYNIRYRRNLWTHWNDINVGIFKRVYLFLKKHVALKSTDTFISEWLCLIRVDIFKRNTKIYISQGTYWMPMINDWTINGQSTNWEFS